ncbi:TIGR04283 family arsenosugar biosynthesis glycosyltransferase [Nitrincola alkalilacustris]|uniref:TIGR04283 family arsenosugar biosynthesis glycosyltransferase n=1 Tax=Nitrincola alkalilacustris TaxID=1571224 RepID=UPI00124E8352|nr:TIGR04283 family arsenosugar biosynthesis glycosyltransferase [Nitrincola alkalilacustris]
MAEPRISIIIPVLNEAGMIQAQLDSLQPLREHAELILVDGGSRDGTLEQVGGRVDHVLRSEPGRATQMNLGAMHASTPRLLFLHLDTRLEWKALQALLIRWPDSSCIWGRYDVNIFGSHPMLRVVACMMNLRSRLTGIATGDQAIFVCRELFAEAGGFPEQPLMEDIEISRRLGARQRPLCLRTRVTTSGRRWQEKGVWRTIWLMWSLRFAYWRGVSAEALALRYGYRPAVQHPSGQGSRHMSGRVSGDSSEHG